jgi:hypothetical protein
MPDPESQPAPEESSPWCFYSTDGDVLGPIERRHLETIWRAGQFPEEVVGFDPATEEWSPLKEWFPGGEKVASDLDEKKFRPPPPELAPLPPSRSHHGRKRKPGAQKVLRWQMATILIFLAAILACVAMAVRTNTAIADHERLAERVESLRTQLEESKESLERLSAATGEVLPPDEAKGRLTLRAPDGSEIPQAGVKVLLYNRRDIERYLDAELVSIPAGANADELARHLVNHLPFPVSTTTTDSKGEYEFRLQAPGDFVLHTNLLQTARGAMLWFLAFNSKEPPHTRIDFKESNRSTSLVPGLVVVPGR